MREATHDDGRRAAALTVLFPRAILDGIAAGRVDLAFRRWRRPTVRPGGTLRTAVGVLAIAAVEPVDDAAVTDAAARRAGFASRAAQLAALDGRAGGRLYRIRFRLAGPDPRLALRARAAMTADERAALRARLARLDARATGGAWTDAALRLIAAHPGVRAAELAARRGVATPDFKRDVRKLKELGLTESLEVGYRLSPRGRSLLRDGSP